MIELLLMLGKYFGHLRTYDSGNTIIFGLVLLRNLVLLKYEIRKKAGESADKTKTRSVMHSEMAVEAWPMCSRSESSRQSARSPPHC